MDRAFQVVIQGPGPWGFRLAGGKDFNSPLQISKVTPGGKAAVQNIYPNDIVTSIDGQDTSSMTHLEAQNKIKVATGSLALNIQRTGDARLWKPTTTRIEPQGVNDSPQFKVSLSANKQPSPQNVGSKHNMTARPFGAGGVSPGTATVVHKQFNSPAGLYSASNIAETFKGQTEGLIAGHMLDGQEEEPQHSSNPGAQSRSFKMLQQHIGDEDVPDAGYVRHTTNSRLSTGPKPVPNSTRETDDQIKYPSYFKRIESPFGPSGGMTNGAKPAGMKSVSAPAVNPNAGSKPISSGQLPICVRCQVGIVGPFVNLKGKSLHPDCFVCEACNCSLRNKGYFTVAGKMYCEKDARAKQMEQQQEQQSPAPAGPSVSNGSMKINLSSTAKPAAQTYSPQPQTYAPQPKTYSSQPQAYSPQTQAYSPQTQAYSQKPPSMKSLPPVVKPKPKVSTDAAPDPNLVIAQALNQNPGAMKSVCGIQPVFTVQNKVSHQIPWESGPSSPRLDDDELPPPPSPTELQQYDASSNDFPAPPPPPPPPPGPEFMINVARPMGLQMKRSPPPDVPVYKAPGEDQPERIKVMFLPEDGKKSTPSQIAQQARTVKNTQPAQSYAPPPQAYTPPSKAYNPQPPGPVLPTVPVFRPSQPKAPSAPGGSAPFSTVPRPSNPGVPKVTPTGTRTPTCEGCGQIIRGPFVSAVGKNWHPEHFVCAHCHEPLQQIGFVEEKGKIYCEKDYSGLYAPKCSKCMQSVTGKCVNALGGQFHPDCFVCFHCDSPIEGNSFHTNEGKVYCSKDYTQLFSTVCASCCFAIEPGDEWLEALGASWHSNCFNCNACQVNLEGHGFYAKNGKPYCPQHA